MAVDQEETGVADTDKVAIASNFILHAPPGEFHEVFNDVRLLFKDDSLLKEGCAKAFAQYHKDQFTPAKIEGVEKPTLITPFNDLGQGRFSDPRTQKSFKFDNLRKETSEIQTFSPNSDTQKAEPLRSAVQSAFDSYAQNHYKSGTVAVFPVATPNASDIVLACCLEAHQFQPKNFHNGRWRSQWTVTVSPNANRVELKGLIRVQVHYYEEGNVQLVSSKEVEKKISFNTAEAALAKEIVKVISDEESIYHTAVSENYATMSETTFKALRRQLPVTRAKFEWNKILNYKIGAELKPQ